MVVVGWGLGGEGRERGGEGEGRGEGVRDRSDGVRSGDGVTGEDLQSKRCVR